MVVAIFASQIDKLREEVKRMQNADMTPKDFGLAVRSDISGLFVTATNKMRTAKDYETTINFSGEVVETRYIHSSKDILDRNLEETTAFLTLVQAAYPMHRDDPEKYPRLSVNLFINPVTTLINFMEQYQNGVTGFERFIEILNEKPETDDEQAEDAGVLRGEIEFRDVSYSYDDKNEVLEHINMKIGRGKKYALVGPSGGGKTTICHLIPHFYDIQEGEILIDGKDIREYTMESLRRNIGIVQQDIYLFNASVRDNILYGRLSATDEEVIEAAKRANIHDYILQMPQGYDTEIGERGVRLSGGQKQRLSIARVFLKDPSILVLDEATSALDNTTELMIQQSLDELCKGRTTIVVAHRLSTIKNADEIAVISRGQIVEQGTHEELMEKNGEYAALYRLQFRDQETENPEAFSLEIG